jgi:hypothetical protein
MGTDLVPHMVLEPRKDTLLPPGIRQFWKLFFQEPTKCESDVIKEIPHDHGYFLELLGDAGRTSTWLASGLEGPPLSPLLVSHLQKSHR